MCGALRSGESFISGTEQQQKQLYQHQYESPSDGRPRVAQTLPDSTEINSGNWNCSKCTFLNQMHCGHCQICGAGHAGSPSLPASSDEYMPPPIPSYMDRLIDPPSVAQMQSYHSSYPLYSDQEVYPRDGNYSNSYSSNSYINNSSGGSSSNNHSSDLMLSGALLGAIVGSGSAFINNRNVLDGATFGAAAGGVSGYLLDQLESRPPSGRGVSSRPQGRGQRRPRDWRPVNPPRGSRSRYAGSGRRRGVGNPEEEFMNMIMLGQFEPMLQHSVSGGINIDNMSYDELYER